MFLQDNDSWTGNTGTGLISEDDYNRLLDFTSIDSEKLEEFSQFVASLGQKKIQGKYLKVFLRAVLKNCPDWWDHKAMSTWILPCLIKSQSPMSTEDWDNTPWTTNIGKAQHHWTNQQTGIQQSWVEAMEGARKVDERIAREIEISVQSGILVNSQNESSHRRARNTMRQSTTIRKSRESHELVDERTRIDLEIEAQKQAQKEGAAQPKELKELKSSTCRTSNSTGWSVSATSNSADASRVALLRAGQRRSSPLCQPPLSLRRRQARRGLCPHLLQPSLCLRRRRDLLFLILAATRASLRGYLLPGLGNENQRSEISEPVI
ncbi:hypothetical protein DFH07DRAFT_810121 [Mycena maculata]|uniref:Uncharacterized protein n=1 Tax=Mycena maculata TaxID=230809 RepID=A0AAD7JJ57_9AGAR|nr:hypothetical protein DFH07DRAFT_810121 [Mycena maculata]